MTRTYLSAFVIFFLVGCSHPTQEKPVPVYSEQALKNLVLTSVELDTNAAKKMLDSQITIAAQDSDILKFTVEYLEKPFGDPNSPYRNEALFREVLMAKLMSPYYGQTVKTLMQKKIDLLQQNQPGNKANDFTYITPEGHNRKLFELRTNHVLLFFYNPECDACKQMKAALAASQVIGKQITSRQLTVLAIYVDRDQKLWRKHIAEIPRDWINGRDDNEYLYKNGVYDLRAIPTLYLLNKDKRVILKDCLDLKKIENQLKD